MYRLRYAVGVPRPSRPGRIRGTGARAAPGPARRVSRRWLWRCLRCRLLHRLALLHRRCRRRLRWHRSGVRCSLDHDLGPPSAGTGYDVAKYIERSAYEGTLPPLRGCSHSSNPVGRRAIEDALTQAHIYWVLHDSERLQQLTKAEVAVVGEEK